MIPTLQRWFERNILELGRELRWSYLPPLMVYMAAGVSGLTNIVGTFFVKDYLGLSAEFLAALGFWVGIPWALKMPLGHLVDLIWRFKALLVYLGAGLIALSLIIMLGLLANPEGMGEYMPVSAWYVLSALLAPIGYVIQDVVADAMTVEAVPHIDEFGNAVAADTLRLMHTTMQTLGRIAIIGGSVGVALLNVIMFNGAAALAETEKLAVYIDIYQLALVIPVISVSGVLLGGWLKLRRYRRLTANGMARQQAWDTVHGDWRRPPVNWWVLGGSLVFVIFTLGMGLGDVAYNQEIIFFGSLGIIVFLITRIVRDLDDYARRVLVGTAIIIFVFRATPSAGPGVTWWMIDELAFDQQFLSTLSLISASIAMLGLFLFRRFIGERSIARIVIILTLVSSFLALPIVGMYYGLHQWTAGITGGVVDARFIAMVDTALESPLGQIAMIPMLAWIANSAPAHLKATFFAVMASFSNLALSASQLGTKYLNQIFTVTREVKDAQNNVQVAADYSELGALLISASVLALLLPILTVLLVKRGRLESA